MNVFITNPDRHYKLVVTHLKHFIWNHTVAIFYLAQTVVTALLIFALGLDHPIYRLMPILMAVPAIFFLIPKVKSSQNTFVIITPVLWYGGIITLLSSISSVPSTGISGNVFHPIEFAALSFIMLHSSVRLNEVKQGLRRPIVITLLICIIFALIDELHQYFIPGRYADPFDIFLDAAGTLAGIIIFFWFFRIFRNVTSY